MLNVDSRMNCHGITRRCGRNAESQAPSQTHGIRIFIFMSSQVIQMHIKDGETFFSNASFLTDSEKYILWLLLSKTY